jgi:putative transcriptional regulator
VKSIDFDIENTLSPQKGSILLSEPFLQDEYFTRSVVLLCEHNQSGSFGLVLNNYIEVNLSDINVSLKETKTKISLGGPVNKNNLFFIHTLGARIKSSYPIYDNLYIGGSHQQVFDFIEQDVSLLSEVRFFLGYAGWEEGQLEMELYEKSWKVLEQIPAQQVMDTQQNELWNKLMKTLGNKYKVMAQFPLDPRLN